MAIHAKSKKKGNDFDLLFLKSKYTQGIAFNIISYCIIGIIGVLLNAIILKFYGPEALGIFNQLYSIYIILSQIAAFGINFSVLHSVSKTNYDYTNLKSILTSAIFLAMLTSIIVVILAYFSQTLWLGVFKSDGVVNGFKYCLPGLFFFVLNKVLLSFLNAIKEMKKYAFFNALRFILLIVFLILIIQSTNKGTKVVIILSYAEVSLFIILFLFTVKYFYLPSFSNLIFWLRIHLKHGLNAMMGNIIADMNTRVDVIMLGIFASDETVGIYSIAAILAEGFLQLTLIFKININPYISELYYSKKNKLAGFIKEKLRGIYKLSIPLAIVAIISFPIITTFWRNQINFNISYSLFIILLLGISISCGYLSLQMIFNQTGRPGIQTLFFISTFITNVFLNVLLIPKYSYYGAAIATSITFILTGLYIKVLAQKILGIRI